MAHTNRYHSHENYATGIRSDRYGSDIQEYSGIQYGYSPEVSTKVLNVNIECKIETKHGSKTFFFRVTKQTKPTTA
jgi:hypothetical protein